MAEDNKPLALNNPQYANLTIILDGTLGVFNVGGIADEGWYSAPITAMGLSVHGDKGPSLAVTLGGIGTADAAAVPCHVDARHAAATHRVGARQPGLDDLPGTDDFAEPAAPGRRPDWRNH